VRLCSSPIFLHVSRTLPESASAAKSKAERLRKLKQIFDKRIIAEAEYEKEKKKILGEND
jgi:hypothetical protein